MNIQLGISSYTFTWAVGVPDSMPKQPLSAIGLIDKACSSGLKLVQIADNLPLELMTEDKLTELHNYSLKKNVAIEMGSRGLSTEHTFKCLETAEKLYSPILRMVIDQPGYQPDLKSIVNIINGLLPEFRKRNIKLAIENHDRFKAKQFEEIIRSTDSEWVGICLDSVNSMGAGEGFETVSELLIPYTFNLHIKDFTIYRVYHKMGFVIEGRPAGKGMLDIRKLVKELSERGRCHSAILELWTPPEAVIEETIIKEERWAAESIDYLKSIFI
ncbi:MAG: sugar phosphate isomerase/epimerase [Bacteroidales bacterium]|nr:sugar phosphate isomerase/epimerase [Bacteroidales bacterium]